MLISDIEEELHQSSGYKEVLLYTHMLCKDIYLNHCDLDNYASTFETPNECLGLIKVLESILHRYSFLHIKLFEVCYHNRDVESLDRLKLGPLREEFISMYNDNYLF